MVAHVNRVFDRLEAKGSPTLRATLQTRTHHSPDQLAGFRRPDLPEWGQTLGVNAPENPFVTVSSPRLAADGFHLQANRVDGPECCACGGGWRQTGGLWEKVANAGLQWLDATLHLSDPTPDAARSYQVRTE